MNKKLLILVVFGIISVLLGGMNSTILIGTQYTATKPGYFYSIAPGGTLVGVTVNSSS